MSNDPRQQPAPLGAGGVDDLQFDRAEPVGSPPGVGEAVAATTSAPPAPPPGVTVCAACRTPISDAYFEANGKVICPRCRDAVVASQNAGIGIAGVFTAVALGIAGGIAGAVVWWAVRHFLHLQIGLIAILVGYLVGSGVRKGTRGRGGVVYQILAVIIAYLAIAANYFPDFLALGIKRGDPAAVAAVNAIVNAFLYPFLRILNQPTGVIGIVIVAFALFQAWVLNRPRRLQFNGPYRLAAGGYAGFAAGPAPGYGVPPPLPPGGRA